MSFELTLRIVLAAAVLGAVFSLRRTPLRRAWDWWLVLGLVLAVTGLTAWRWPGAAGTIGGVTYGVLLVLPSTLVRSAWRLAARGEIPRARVRARHARWLHPLGSVRALGSMVDLAARVEAGEALDVTSAVAAPGVPEGIERALTALMLVSWSGDFARVAALLEDTVVRREAVRQGNAALVLAAAGEAGGPDAVARAWTELARDDPSPAPSVHTAGVMLVATAHLGMVEACRSLARELSREVPAARAAYWVATAEQRAGDVVTAHATLTAAAAVPGLSPGAVRRLEHRMMHPVDPVEVPPSAMVAALSVALGARVEARRALAGLGVGRGARRPAPVTWTLTAVLAAVFAGELVAGMGPTATETLYRMGGLPVPLPSGASVVRLLTYGLVHASAGHLAVNLLTLVFFGRFVEQRLGGARMLGLYVAAGVAGGVAALAGSADGSLVVGASGSIFGLVGAAAGQILADRALRTTPEGRSELALLGGLLLVQAAGDVLAPHVSSAAHVGGVVAGFAAGVALRRR